MRLLRNFSFLLFCTLLLSVSGCRNKGIACPKPNGKTAKVRGKNGSEFEAIRVQTDKNGRVKKRKKLLF